MPSFVDLHVLPHVDDIKSCRQIAQTLALAGYSMIGLTVPTGLFHDRLAEVRRTFSDYDVETVTRVDFASRSRGELLRSLRKFRTVFDIVAVKCLNDHVAHVACRDRRVDLVFFELENPKVRLTHAMANMLRGCIELNMAPVILRTGAVYGTVSRQFVLAKEHSVKVVLSSGLDRAELVRSPIQMVALAATLGLPRIEAVKGITSIPMSAVETNLKKRSPDYIEEGVRVVQRKPR